ncbi:tegument protein [Murid herpesvirus 3]|uniref:Tegument protein UL51 homolog n=2 Tax=Murid betaherpesvirus 3 TaxID=2560603 RepID=A0A1P8VIU4_9BETA|nr:tegument protein [Murine roseolovirus]APZ76273.1 tegument protein [Murid betaherpesvirus 3]AYH64786.1 tegument protein [Murid herpesvirus 3]
MGNCLRAYFKGFSTPPTSSDYYLLINDDYPEMSELEDFIESQYKDFGIYKNDIINNRTDNEVFASLYKILPIYKRTKLKYQIIEKYMPTCLPHMRDALQVEYKKAKKILEALDVVFLKSIIGEFSICTDNLDCLINKFSTDQSTLCDVNKILNLVEMDGETSKKILMDTDVNDESICDFPALPEVPHGLLEIETKEFSERIDERMLIKI